MALNLDNIASAIAEAISANAEWNNLLVAARAAKWKESSDGKKIPPQEFIQFKDLMWSFKLVTSDDKEFIIRKELVKPKASTSAKKYENFNYVFDMIYKQQTEVKTKFALKDLKG